MAEIFHFQGKSTASVGGFSTDENHKLAFRTGEDGAVSLGNFSTNDFGDLFPDPRKDWGNQELADLYRVHQLLSGANVPVETDRGVTDEGDPWFIFCHPNGDVFIHICRLDGEYILDNPNLARPLRGHSFRDLISDFTHGTLTSDRDEDIKHNESHTVVHLNRNGKVRLHPSVMLAALVWTLFLASEELVLVLPQEEERDDSLLKFDADAPLQALAEGLSLEEWQDKKAELSSVEKEDNGDVAADEFAGHLREGSHLQQGLMAQNNVFTVGLSSIAIAMGFVSEVLLMDNKREILEGLNKLGLNFLGLDAAEQAEQEQPDTGEDIDLLAMLADFVGVDLDVTVAGTKSVAEKAPKSALGEELEYDADQLAAAEALTVGTPTPSDQKLAKAADAEAASEASRKSAQAPGQTPMAEEPSSEAKLASILKNWESGLEELEVGSSVVFASFDISETDAFALLSYVSEHQLKHEDDLRSFDMTANRLIDFLEARNGSIDFIKLDNEIIMIDRTAVTGGETDFIQWEAEDGRTISFIGLAADFQQFEMIA